MLMSKQSCSLLNQKLYWQESWNSQCFENLKNEEVWQQISILNTKKVL